LKLDEAQMAGRVQQQNVRPAAATVETQAQQIVRAVGVVGLLPVSIIVNGLTNAINCSSVR